MRQSLGKPATMLIAALAMLAIATFSTYAGTDHSNGGGADNGQKQGTYHKTDGGCGTGWALVGEDQVSSAYDLNEDGYVCQRETSSGLDYTDNTVKVAE